ncbi:hypothetical protein DL96DRAFT_1530372 [Flagelloscypha sp. PMI_526]|nr:hypothetical protein DL96DRAFT_1530372 [Flagelloscypha sp. PMI_526]
MDDHASSRSAMGVQPPNSHETNPELHSHATSSSNSVHATNTSPNGCSRPLPESSASESDSDNSELRKERSPHQGEHEATNGAPKKVLYIPVSDNIREVDARRLFNLLSQFESVKSNSGKSYNYEEKYPEDPPGQELGEDARVFKVYNDLADEYDRDMIRGFRDTLDSLLIFASLFSAVITTFVVQTAQALPTNQSVITNHLLVDIATLLRANGNATILSGLPPSNFGPDTSTYKTTDIWINGLFFASLSLSLATALLSVLAKQWLRAYTAVISGPAKEIALIRHLRFRGLEKWKMNEIIGALPLVLHASLGLFFAGLFVFVRTLYEGIAFVVVIISGLAFLCYLSSIILPAIDLQCPYRVTLLYRPSKYAVYATQCFYYILRRVWWSIVQAVSPSYNSRMRLLNNT